MDENKSLIDKEDFKVRRAYWRCNSAHYYSSLHCPIDGWTFKGCAQLMAAVENTERRSEALSIQALSQAGAPEDAINRTIIIEFGSDESVFDALLPEGYLIDGEIKKVHQLGHEHL